MNKENNFIIQKINRRNEHKFTEKRNPYKKYQKAKWKWTDIFCEIDLLKSEGSFKIIKTTAKKYNINYGTLKNKYNKYSNDNEYNNFNEENRGINNKSFTDQEEYEIFLFLKENFIDKHKVLCNDIIKIYAKNKFNELYPTNKFNASDGWCNMFKKRWNLTTVKISISKVATKVYTEDEINIFFKKCKDSLIKVTPNFFST